MSAGVRKRAGAKRDLAQHSGYIAGDSLDAALRFLAAAEETMRALAAMPRQGAPWVSPDPRLADVRRHPVRGFGNYLIFYRPVAGGIDVLRVLHGAQDIPSVLADELADEADANPG